MTDNSKQFKIDPSYRRVFVKAHLNFEIVREHGTTTFSRPLREEGSQWNKLIWNEKRIVQILQMDGVVYITLKPYEISIELGELFTDHTEVVERLRELLSVTYSAEEILPEPTTGDATGSELAPTGA